MLAEVGVLTIGKLSKATGLGVEAIRYYEREGLLPPPARSPGGYRLYGQEAVATIGFIQRAKDLGFTLAEAQELLSLRASEEAECSEIESRAQAKLGAIEEKLASLSAIKVALESLIAQCQSGTAPKTCPLLEALEGELK